MHVVFIIRGIVNSWTRPTTKTTKIGSPRTKSISQYVLGAYIHNVHNNLLAPTGGEKEQIIPIIINMASN